MQLAALARAAEPLEKSHGSDPVLYQQFFKVPYSNDVELNSSSTSLPLASRNKDKKFCFDSLL